MSRGERDKDLGAIIRDAKHRHNKCPICGKRAMSRFYNEEKKLYFYKHQRRTVKRFIGIELSEEYFEIAQKRIGA